MVGGFPDLEPEVVRREDGPADMVGADEEDLTALDYRDRAALHPDILPDQGRAWRNGIVGVPRYGGTLPHFGWTGMAQDTSCLIVELTGLENFL